MPTTIRRHNKLHFVNSMCPHVLDKSIQTRIEYPFQFILSHPFQDNKSMRYHVLLGIFLRLQIACIPKYTYRYVLSDPLSRFQIKKLF